MQCKWNTEDCKFADTTRCSVCFTLKQEYKPRPIKKKTGLRIRAQKMDNRQGSSFEAANHKQNANLIKQTESFMTINSGATRRQKGDENIQGYIRVSEELKTQMPNRVKGVKSFTIQRSWLDKLHLESLQHDQEFWYLVFAFSEDEGVNPAGDTFVVAEKDMIFSMVRTIIEDRKRADLAAKAADISQKELEVVQAENNLLHAKIRLLEAKLKGDIIGLMDD